jgi:hypothetical protein
MRCFNSRFSLPVGFCDPDSVSVTACSAVSVIRFPSTMSFAASLSIFRKDRPPTNREREERVQGKETVGFVSL